jgi:hypothetical protein
VILSRKSPDREGDAVACSTLRYHLERTVEQSQNDKQALRLWIKYLTAIETNLIGSNYTQRLSKSEFDFPFEKDYVLKDDKNLFQEVTFPSASVKLSPNDAITATVTPCPDCKGAGCSKCQGLGWASKLT